MLAVHSQIRPRRDLAGSTEGACTLSIQCGRPASAFLDMPFYSTLMDLCCPRMFALQTPNYGRSIYKIRDRLVGSAEDLRGHYRKLVLNFLSDGADVTDNLLYTWGTWSNDDGTLVLRAKRALLRRPPVDTYCP